MHKLPLLIFAWLISLFFYPVSSFSQAFCGFTCEDCLKQAFIANNKVKVLSNISYASPTISNDFIDYQISKSGCLIDSSCLYGNDAAENSLLYDVYYPNLSCGSYPLLPAIILFHGGGFSECTTKAGMEDYCRDFARLGFVAFSVEYRRGKKSDNTSLTASYILAGYRGLQDARGAIRSIIKKQNDGTQPYKIDINKIFIGGESEGGVIAVNTAYLSQTQADEVMPGVSNVLGSIDDTAPMPPFYYGEPTINFTIRGVFNLWGALSASDSSGSPADFIDPGEPPFIGFHGMQDFTVPYNAVSVDYSTGSNATAMQCDNILYTNPEAGTPAWLLGSSAIYDKCQEKNICAEVYLDSDMGHGFGNDPDPFGLPFNNKSKVKDYVVQRAATFFQAVLCGECDNINTSLFQDCINQRCKAASLSDMADKFTCIMQREVSNEKQESSWKILTTSSYIRILFSENEMHTVQMCNLSGQVVRSMSGTTDELEIDTADFPSGMYIIRISTASETGTQKVFLVP